jgi:hypothetical protein
MQIFYCALMCLLWLILKSLNQVCILMDQRRMVADHENIDQWIYYTLQSKDTNSFE